VVIVTDYGSTIDKMMEVIKEVDAQSGAEKIYIIYLTNADASDVAQKLEQIFGVASRAGSSAPPVPQRPNQPQRGQPANTGGAQASGSSVPSQIIPDTRTNSLIVIASEHQPAARARWPGCRNPVHLFRPLD
jgi:general secretion pathway protein D